MRMLLRTPWKSIVSRQKLGRSSRRISGQFYFTIGGVDGWLHHNVVIHLLGSAKPRLPSSFVCRTLRISTAINLVAQGYRSDFFKTNYNREKDFKNFERSSLVGCLMALKEQYLSRRKKINSTSKRFIGKFQPLFHRFQQVVENHDTLLMGF